MKIAIIAIFEYRWASGELHKSREYIAPRFQPTPEPFEETYFVWRGRHITEIAFRQEDHRFIGDYRRIFRNRPNEVNPISYFWHEKVLGDILSTMYAFIGLRETKYLVRCFNRSDFPDVRLSQNQFELLNKICEHISLRLFAKSSERRLLEKLEINQWKTNSEASIRKLTGLWLLEYEVMRSGIILWTHELDVDDRFTQTYGFGPLLLTWHRTDDMKIISDKLYKDMMGYEEPFILDVTGEEYRYTEPHTLEAHLRDGPTNIAYLLGIPFNIKERKTSDQNQTNDNDARYTRRGVMVFPLEKRADQAPPLTAANDLSRIPEKLDVLETLAAIAGSIIKGHYQL